MDVIELIPGLHYLRFPVGHAYLCEDPDGLTLIDTSVPGAAPQIATAIRRLGHDPGELRLLLLTHFHADHASSAAEIAAWGGAEVCAHRADAPVLRGEAPGPPPDLAGWERPLFDQVSRQLPAAPPAPVRIDRELGDGDELTFGGGATTMAVPGHTPGSVAFYLPGAASCSQATPQPAAPQARSCPACSTPTAPRPPHPSGGWPTWTPSSPASATENPSPRTQRPNSGRPPGSSMITGGEIAAGNHGEYALPEYASPPARSAPSAPLS